jgi:DNA-binding NtrC family response regulator
MSAAAPAIAPVAPEPEPMSEHEPERRTYVIGKLFVVNLADELPPLAEARAALDEAIIRAALERSGGKVARAARLLGVERSYLHKTIARRGIRRQTGSGE